MKTPFPIVVLVTLLSLGSAGCSSLSNTQRGALIGAGAGGAVGAVVGNAAGSTARARSSARWWEGPPEQSSGAG